MDFIAALASSVVASMPIRLPCNNPRSASRFSTQENTCSCVSRSINLRVRDRVEWSGVASVKACPETVAAPANQLRARRCRALPRCLQNIQSIAHESRCRAAAMDVRTYRRKTWRSMLRRRDRSVPHRVTHSTSRKTDALAPTPSAYAQSIMVPAFADLHACLSPYLLDVLNPYLYRTKTRL